MVDNAKGALFKNAKKQGQQPDYTGNLDLSVDMLNVLLAEAKKNNGTYKARIAAWVKTGNNKPPFLSVSLNSPYDKPAGGQSGGRSIDDSDIPF